jgi:biotin synthase
MSWTPEAVLELLEAPFNDLLYRAHRVHRENFDPNTIQLSTLLSIKTGGCPEDCQYCPQAKRYHTGVEDEPLLTVDAVLAAAHAAKDERRDPLLHGRRLARAEGARPGASVAAHRCGS